MTLLAAARIHRACAIRLVPKPDNSNCRNPGNHTGQSSSISTGVHCFPRKITEDKTGPRAFEGKHTLEQGKHIGKENLSLLIWTIQIIGKPICGPSRHRFVHVPAGASL